MSGVKKKPQSAPGSVGRARAVLHEVVETCADPAQLLELYYWSAEVELLATLHAYLGLPEQPRDALRAFLTMVADCPDSVLVSVNQNGDVTLSSPAVAQLMDTMNAVRPTTDPTDERH